MLNAFSILRRRARTRVHEVAGAFAGLAIALNGLLTALVLPLLVHFWRR
jgi:putative effector of murein hydrolase